MATAHAKQQQALVDPGNLSGTIIPPPPVQGRIDICFHAVAVSPVCSCPDLVTQCRLQLSVLFWAGRSDSCLWFSAVADHLKVLKSCTIGGGTLSALFARSGLFLWLLLPLNHPEQLWTFSSDNRKAYWSTSLPLTGYTLLFSPFSGHQRHGCWWK